MNQRHRVTIIPYSPRYAEAIADLYHAAVHDIDSTIYTLNQKEAWAPTPPDYDHWRARLEAKQPFMALMNDRVAGFMELEADGHIDCAYTHPDFQGIGVASALYQHLEASALSRGMKHLYVEASYGIRPFFERRGFTLLHTNQVQRSAETLTNFSMEKHIQP